MKTIKEVRHVVMGIAFSPAGEVMGGKKVAEVNAEISEIAKGYDEVQTHINRPTKDEAGDPAFLSILYIFVKYAEDTATAKSK